MRKFLILAGTTEGRHVLELLVGCNCELWVSAATEYGGESLPLAEGVTILTGRLEEHAMRTLLLRECFDCVFDATHPFAREVTENISAACKAVGIRYLRIVRNDDGNVGGNDIQVASVAEAAKYLAEHTQGNILLTTGSKELAAFATIPNFAQRVYARVLPLAESLRQCEAVGLAASHIICMQGPFSAELNVAMLGQIDAKWLVTKETGDAGGFAAKCDGAALVGASALVITRPSEDGITLAQLPAWMQEHFNIAVHTQGKQQKAVVATRGKMSAPDFNTCNTNTSYFPLFLSLSGTTVVVLGGGVIAARRVLALVEFGCCVRVISPECCQVLEAAAARGKIELISRRYVQGDCAGASLVVAATNERAANAAAARECKMLCVPISVADKKEESTFYFPGIIRNGCITIGVTASGENHRLACAVTQRIRSEAEGFIKACEEELE